MCAQEISTALASRGVAATEELVNMFIEGAPVALQSGALAPLMETGEEAGGLRGGDQPTASAAVAPLPSPLRAHAPLSPLPPPCSRRL